MKHIVVSATVNGEPLYSQTHHTMLDAIEDVGDLMFYDPDKIVTLRNCDCSDERSHSDGVVYHARVHAAKASVKLV